jgi:DNA-directed RNA polymerase specialized sigma24 family protein
MEEWAKKEYGQLASYMFEDLTEKEALSVLFFFVWGREEAARQLGVSAETIKSNVRLARSRLKKQKQGSLETYFLFRMLTICKK